MSRLLSKRIKRSSRNRTLRQGLERLEIRNLLAADLLPEFVSAAKEETDSEEGPYELAVDFGKVEMISFAVGTEGGDQELERKLLADEQPMLWLESSETEFLEFQEFEPSMTFRTLAMFDDSPVEEEFIAFSVFDDGSLFDEPIYFRSLSGVVDDEGAFEDDILRSEVFDDSEVFYTLSFGDVDEITDEAVREMVPFSDVVQLDEVSYDDEIRTFGGITSDNEEVLTTTAAPLMSPWYNSDNPLDTNGDGVTSAIDALIVFNSLTQLGSAQLSHALFAQASATAAISINESFLVDANNDGYLSPLDLLMRINFLNQSAVTDESAADAPFDAEADQARLGDFASILPGEWDQYESSDEGDLNDSRLSDDSGDELSTEDFGARLRDPELDWPEDELDAEPNDAEADDEFWSKFADDESDAILDEETLDILASV